MAFVGASPGFHSLIKEQIARFMAKSANVIAGIRNGFQEEVRFLVRKSQHKTLSEVGGGGKQNGLPGTDEGKEEGRGCQAFLKGLRRSWGILEDSVAGSRR